MNSSAPTARRGGSRICAASASGLPEGDVLADGAGEQERLLRDDPHLRAQRAAGDVAQVVPVDQDAPGGRVVEARDELCHRRLARAGRADERDGLHRAAIAGRRRRARSTRARASSPRRPRRAVGEGDVLEADLAADRAQLDRVRAVVRSGARRAAGRSSRARPCRTGRSRRAGRAAGSVRTGSTARRRRRRPCRP